ncbi:uncharacterized protein LOC111393017 [Olea europaea var. sylvestris]|uniref:uncharacterized protein LOC111393017 n=1 Tax=Olea europaea var. sylvestris TaxID=158386 RepID=UPI000C1D0D1A|nr:uncharacterized protein LOC111393017 [Olea europaea var. sylvestris]
MKLQAINSNPKISFPSSSNSQFASKNIQNHPGSCSLLQNSNCKFSRININCYKPISISASYGGRESESGDDVTSSPAKALRRVLGSPGIHLGPACFDALSAKLVERAGFDLCFTTGFGISAARLGLPDTGLISYGEMVDQGRQITQATSIPVIGDGDNGYGNAMNVKRTIKGYIRAGFAGIILEDQVYIAVEFSFNVSSTASIFSSIFVYQVYNTWSDVSYLLISSMKLLLFFLLEKFLTASFFQAGFLDGITNIVPALGGINIKALLDDAASEVGGKQLLDFNDTMGDRIQVFLE